jgi:UDP:flavonoid glycosyltransferase YjiC (YdhE family)
VKKYLFIPLSGPGYLFPAIRLAHVLEQNGHGVLFSTTSEYTIMLETQGLKVAGVRNSGLPFLHSGDWHNPGNAQAEVRVLGRIVEQIQPDGIVTNPLVLASFVLAERYRLPLFNVAFAEYLYPARQADDANKTWRLGAITDFYNRYRASLGLSAITADPLASPLIGDRYFLRSSRELYGDDELPARVSFIGDLYWEPPYRNHRLAGFCQRQREAGRPLVYVQIGRLFEEKHVWGQLLGFFSEMRAAFVVDVGRADYLDAGSPPPNCFFDAFVPLGACAADVELVISSGQSTTCLSAIRHGKQLVCLPHSADSTELTRRLESKGVALGLHGPRRVSRELVQGAVRHLLGKPLVKDVERYQRTLLAYDDARIHQVFAGTGA